MPAPKIFQRRAGLKADEIAVIDGGQRQDVGNCIPFPGKVFTAGQLAIQPGDEIADRLAIMYSLR